MVSKSFNNSKQMSKRKLKNLMIIVIFIILFSTIVQGIKIQDNNKMKSNIINQPLDDKNIDSLNIIDYTPLVQNIIQNKAYFVNTFGNESLINILDGPQRTYLPLAISPNNTILAFLDDNNSIKLWNIATNTLITTLSGTQFSAEFIEFSSDGKYLATGGEAPDYSIKIFNIETRTVEQTLIGHTGVVKTVAFSPKNDYLVSGGYDTQLLLWDIRNNKLLDKQSVSDNENSWISSIKFSPTDNIIAVSNYDSTIGLWRLLELTHTTAELDYENTISNTTAAIYTINFSNDGQYLVSAGKDPKINIWSMENETLLDTINTTSQIWSVIFSKDGKILFSAGADSNITLWNTTTNQEITVFSEHKNQVKSLVISPDNTLLVSSSWDKKIHFYNIAQVENDSDIDLDGMPSSWEDKYGLDDLDYSDKYLDLDGDGLYNGLEYYLNSNPNSTDSDDDGMDDGWEYKYKLDLNVDDSFLDLDSDGLKNLYEFLFNFDPTDDFDALGDIDHDGMSTGWEAYYGFNPVDPSDGDEDADGDGIPNNIEAIYGFDPHDPSDAEGDEDGDTMSNVWEYKMGLDPYDSKDALFDSDNDGLNNLREWQFGSSAILIDTDNDGMDDFYEYNMGLNPIVDDAKDDLDEDGMPNIYEYNHGFFANNPDDAYEDPDGDLVNNVVESKLGTNPFDILSVPLFELSLLHVLLFILIVLVISGFIVYKKLDTRKQLRLVEKFIAPNYKSALQVKKSGYTNYEQFLEAFNIAKGQYIDVGLNNYYEGDYLNAILQLEKGLTIYEKLENIELIAETVFLITLVNKDMNTLSENISVLKRFPDLDSNSTSKIYKEMIDALIAEVENNFGLALNNWNEAVTSDLISVYSKIICQGALINIMLQRFISNPEETNKKSLESNINEWIEQIKINKAYYYLSHAYLLSARFSLATYNFNEVGNWFNKCLEIAEQNKFIKIFENVTDEKANFLKHFEEIKTQISEDTVLTPEEQEEMFQDYVKDVFKTLKEHKNQD